MSPGSRMETPYALHCDIAVSSVMMDRYSGSVLGMWAISMGSVGRDFFFAGFVLGVGASPPKPYKVRPCLLNA
eukprot:6365542-Prymnesium_polylepis.1